MEITLINPRLSFLKNDFLGSGVPYWPIELMTFASHLKKNKNIKINVIDLFGDNPHKLEFKNSAYLQGNKIENSSYINKINNSEIFIIYAISYMAHDEILNITKYLKKFKKKICVLENSQAVTAYSLEEKSTDFFNNGVDVIICGEPYFNSDQILEFIQKDNYFIEKTPNVITKNFKLIRRIYKKNYEYPIPSWDLIKLDNYWKLPYSHGPKTGKFFPILTSRGCPYPCDFCVVPNTNDKKWRTNNLENIIKEIKFLKTKYNVKDFQIEDLNPTVKNSRWLALCSAIIKEKLDINFYIVSGTKAETIKIIDVELLKKAGCRYISISPESGSKNVMKIIGKKFDYNHAISLIKECNKFKIYTQACLLVGHPGENHDDFLKTKMYLKKMLDNGLDEVAIFIVSAFAGSKLYKLNTIKYNNKDDTISFSSKNRIDYLFQTKKRRELLKIFFLHKIVSLKFYSQILRSITVMPKTKMENLPMRIVYIFFLIVYNKLFK